MKFFSSTKVRLTLWYASVLAVILVGFASATYYWFESVLRSQTDATLTEIAETFEESADRELREIDAQGPEPLEDKLKKAVEDSTVEVRFKNYSIFVFSGAGNLLSSTGTNDSGAGISSAVARKWLDRFLEFKENNKDGFADDGDAYRVHYHSFRLRGIDHFLIVIHPLDEMQELLRKVRFAFLVTVPLSLLLASLGGYLLMKKSFGPIAVMSKKAEAITASSLHERLPVREREDELGSLAAAFNRLLARLDLSFEQQQRFMADASHELRTPVAIVRGEADVSLTKEDRTTDEYRETISIMGREGERMSRIIEDLFTLARADAGEETVSKGLVYIEDILAGTIKSFRSLAAKRDIELAVGNLPEMPFEANEPQLRRLFVNLLDNAVKFATSRVTVSAAVENEEYVIRISDDGEGIPPESRDHIFERFYRVDRARSRQETSSGAGGGAGLGLPITRWIAEDHGGTVELSSTGDDGTTFTVFLPAASN